MKKLEKEKRFDSWMLWTVAVIGVVFIILARDARLGMIVFLLATCIESGLFSLIYGARSKWRSSDPARAVFWIIFSYFLVSCHILVSYFWRADYALREDIRQFLYLFMTLAGLNILLTARRVQQYTIREKHRLEDAILRAQTEGP